MVNKGLLVIYSGNVIRGTNILYKLIQRIKVSDILILIYSYKLLTKNSSLAVLKR